VGHETHQIVQHEQEVVLDALKSAWSWLGCSPCTPWPPYTTWTNEGHTLLVYVNNNFHTTILGLGALRYQICVFLTICTFCTAKRLTKVRLGHIIVCLCNYLLIIGKPFFNWVEDWWHFWGQRLANQVHNDT
jgi:hypothetical protein